MPDIQIVNNVITVLDDSGSPTYTIPTDDGQPNEVLVTDGAGTLTFQTNVPANTTIFLEVANAVPLIANQTTKFLEVANASVYLEKANASVYLEVANTPANTSISNAAFYTSNGNLKILTNDGRTFSLDLSSLENQVLSSDFTQTTANGTATDFTSPITTSDPKDLLVSIDGVVQTPNTDYTVSGTTVTFDEAPANNNSIVIRTGGTVVATNVPSFLLYGENSQFTGQTVASEAKTTDSSQNGQGWRMPLGGTVTHITAQMNVDTAAGNLEAELYKNGVATGKKLTVSLSSTGDVGGDTEITEESFSAGDRLTIFWKHTSGSAVTQDHAFTIRILSSLT